MNPPFDVTAPSFASRRLRVTLRDDTEVKLEVELQLGEPEVIRDRIAALLGRMTGKKPNVFHRKVLAVLGPEFKLVNGSRRGNQSIA